MGTRHLVAVVLDGEFKVAQYGQWDGYLDGQGRDVVEFIQDKLDLRKFKKAVRACHFVDQAFVDNLWEKTVGTKAGNLVPVNEADLFSNRYPEFSRDTGADILNMIQKSNGLNLVNSVDFAADSLFCEWAYVLDLDTKTLEIYKGFNTSPLPKSERFAFLKGSEKVSGWTGETYYPVKLFKKLPFAKVCRSELNKIIKEYNSSEE